MRTVLFINRFIYMYLFKSRTMFINTAVKSLVQRCFLSYGLYSEARGVRSILLVDKLVLWLNLADKFTTRYTVRVQNNFQIVIDS